MFSQNYAAGISKLFFRDFIFSGVVEEVFHRVAKNKQRKKKIPLETDIKKHPNSKNAAVKDITVSLTAFAGRAFSILKLGSSVVFTHKT